MGAARKRKEKKWMYKGRIRNQYRTISLLSCTLTAKDEEAVTKRIEQLLNKEAQDGWRVVGVAFGHRIILERVLVQDF